MFQLAAGNIGYKIFGVVMWAAAITSVVGAAYTSVSFISTFSEKINKKANWIIIGFIVFQQFAFVLIGKPVKVLICSRGH